MSTTIGKSAGVVLLLAAGLLLALYAAGVFTARPASADEHALTELTVKQGEFHSSSLLALRPAFTTGTYNYEAFTSSTLPLDTLRLQAEVSRASSATVVVAASSDDINIGGDINDADDFRYVHLVTADGEDTQDVTGALITVTTSVAGQTPLVYTIRVRQTGVITNTDEAGATVRLTVQAKLAATVGNPIVLGLKSFGLPSTIDKSNVTITHGSASGNPSDVTVSRDNVTLYFARIGTGDNAVDALDDAELTTIVISTQANIKNPTKAGTYLVTIDSKDNADTNGVDARQVAMTVRGIKISPTSGGKNAEITVTGTGFSDQDGSVFRDANGDGMYNPDDEDEVLGTVEVVKGAFTFTTNAITSDSTINFIDYNGDTAAEGKAFEIKASIKVTPAQVSPAEDLTIELVDWTAGEAVTKVRFGGDNGPQVDATGSRSNDGDKFTVVVPPNVRLGSLKVEVIVGDTSKASASVTVRAQTLTLSPTSAVPRQEITIQGSGFGAGTVINSVMFASSEENVATGIAPRERTADTNGNITLTVMVPEDVNPGDREVKATGMNNRIGTAVLNIPKPTLTIDPAESLRGTTVTVTGTGFASNDLIQILYDQHDGDDVTPRPVTTANTDTTGAFTASFAVPSFARIGDTSNVTADSQLIQPESNFPDVTVEHKTPKPTITISPGRAAVGSTIEISGDNFAGFAPVGELMISDRDVKPVPTPATERNGSITMPGILVPQLDPGSYTVKLEIAGQIVTKFIEVTDEPVSTAPADVFEPVGDNLVVVWHYDNETATWTSYSPTVPAELNDLEMVASGAIVWVQVSEAMEFRGGTPRNLVAGWNLISIN